MSKQDYPRRKKNDSWATDGWIQDLFPLTPSYAEYAKHSVIWFDPCPLDDNWTRDGLECAWCDRTFVNPPYSNPLPWVEKAIHWHQATDATIVMLLKHDTSTKWYAKLHEAGAKILMVQGRLKYGSKKGAAFPSVLMILSNKP